MMKWRMEEKNMRSSIKKNKKYKYILLKEEDS